MGLDVYFRRDIANVLRATAIANADTGPERVGLMRGLVAVGLAFGLEPKQDTTVQRESGRQNAIPQWVEVRHD